MRADERAGALTRERVQRFALGSTVFLSASLSIGIGVVVGGWLGGDHWVSVAVLAALPLGVVSVDVVSGMVHWLCDTFGSPDTPVFGPLIQTFREHHRDPQAMLDHDWVETNGACCLLTSTALILLCPVVASVNSPFGVFGVAYVWTMATVGAASSQIHKWAHMEEVPQVAAILQSLRLALPPEQHRRHHRAPYKSGYCITTGWSNALLDGLGFWSWLERRTGRSR